MTRTYKTVTRTRTYETLEKISCDLCGAVGTGGEWERSSAWSVGGVTVEVEIHQKEGESYPEGGSGTEYVIDLCPACFKNRLVAWLRSEGADIKEMDWDW